MKRYLILLCFCLLSVSLIAEEDVFESMILSSADQIAVLKNESSQFIGGIVSPLGGQPSLRKTDMVVKGALGLNLTRFYIPPYMPCNFSQHEKNQKEYDKLSLFYHLKYNYRGWQFLSHARLHYNPENRDVYFSEPNGAIYNFQITETETKLISPVYALSNLLEDEPSAKFDPRNNRISCEDEGKRIVVQTPDGTKRFYEKKGVVNKAFHLFCL